MTGDSERAAEIALDLVGAGSSPTADVMRRSLAAAGLRGIEQERARIVEWLRAQTNEPCIMEGWAALNHAASEIENGEHHAS